MQDKSTVERIELAETQPQVQPDAKLSERDYRLVKDVEVLVDVDLGSVQLTLQQLFDLKAGEVLRLDKEVSEPVEVIVNGKTIALGNLVAVDGCFGVEITRIQE